MLQLLLSWYACDLKFLLLLSKWLLEAKASIQKEFEGTTRDDFFNHCRSGKYDQVVAIYRSNESTALTGPFNRELVQILPKSVKYICHNGAGYDNIEVGACSERGTQFSLVHHNLFQLCKKEKRKKRRKKRKKIDSFYLDSSA